jgi:hypothetical protein
MKAMFQKHKILESIDELDLEQREQVHTYIKGLSSKIANDKGDMNLKREAMRQIRLALRPDRLYQASF